MRNQLRRVLMAGALGGGAAGLAFGVGVRRQQRTLAAQIDELRRAGRAAPHQAPWPDAHPGDALPVPVARYLTWALRGQTAVEEVQIRQVGRLRTDVRSGRWMPFEADHLVVPPASGFVWNAAVSVAPLVHVRVTDALVAGRGSGRVTLLSAFPLDEDAGTPEMNAGSLHRYLAEAVWYPVALRPSDQLRWTAIDTSRALATLTASGVTVSLEFRFAPTGEVTGIYTPARWGSFPEGYREAPWEGHFRDYQERHGMMVPSAGDVGWYVDDGWHAVWEGRITTLVVRTGSRSDADVSAGSTRST